MQTFILKSIKYYIIIYKYSEHSLCEQIPNFTACADRKSTRHWGPVWLHWQVQHWIGSTVQWHPGKVNAVTIWPQLYTMGHFGRLELWADEWLAFKPDPCFVLKTLPQKVGEICAQWEPAPGEHRGARLLGQTAALWPSSPAHSQRGHGTSLLL